MRSQETLQRLVRVLKTQERQSRTQMEAAVAGLAQLRQLQERATLLETEGRRLVTASVANGEIAERLTGIETARAAVADAEALMPEIAGVEEMVEKRRQEFLARRRERRQVEALIAAQEARASARENRRDQQRTDDWYLRQRQRTQGPDRDDL